MKQIETNSLNIYDTLYSPKGLNYLDLILNNKEHNQAFVKNRSAASIIFDGQDTARGKLLYDKVAAKEDTYTELFNTWCKTELGDNQVRANFIDTINDNTALLNMLDNKHICDELNTTKFIQSYINNISFWGSITSASEKEIVLGYITQLLRIYDKPTLLKNTTTVAKILALLLDKDLQKYNSVEEFLEDNDVNDILENNDDVFLTLYYYNINLIPSSIILEYLRKDSILNVLYNKTNRSVTHNNIHDDYISASDSDSFLTKLVNRTEEDSFILVNPWSYYDLMVEKYDEENCVIAYWVDNTHLCVGLYNYIDKQFTVPFKTHYIGSKLNGAIYRSMCVLPNKDIVIVTNYSRTVSSSTYYDFRVTVLNSNLDIIVNKKHLPQSSTTSVYHVVRIVPLSNNNICVCCANKVSSPYYYYYIVDPYTASMNMIGRPADTKTVVTMRSYLDYSEEYDIIFMISNTSSTYYEQIIILNKNNAFVDALDLTSITSAGSECLNCIVYKDKVNPNLIHTFLRSTSGSSSYYYYYRDGIFDLNTRTFTLEYGTSGYSSGHITTQSHDIIQEAICFNEDCLLTCIDKDGSGPICPHICDANLKTKLHLNFRLTDGSSNNSRSGGNIRLFRNTDNTIVYVNYYSSYVYIKPFLINEEV